jgi:glyoxylase-like metal-dependent hydrolase (beta-lactamase superfamily II)
MAGPRRLYVLDLGRIESDLNWVLPMHSPASAAEPNRPATWAKVPTLAFLIEHDTAGWILFDTGCHPEAMNGHWPGFMAASSPCIVGEANSLPGQLALLGLTPADISTVVISHLHMDHVGGLVHFADTDAGSRVVVGKDELAEALLRTHERPRPYGYGYIRDVFVLPGIAWELVTRDRQLAEGVELLTLPGHTIGMLGMLVELPETGPVLLPSDTTYTRQNYGPPLRPPAAVHDSEGLRESVERLRELERRRGARIIFSHDWDQYEQELVLAPEGYA